MSVITDLGTALASVFNTTPAAGNALARALHYHAANSGLDLDKKTMTATWEQNNAAQAAVLLTQPPDAKGLSWRIIPD